MAVGEAAQVTEVALVSLVLLVLGLCVIVLTNLKEEEEEEKKERKEESQLGFVQVNLPMRFFTPLLLKLLRLGPDNQLLEGNRAMVDVHHHFFANDNEVKVEVEVEVVVVAVEVSFPKFNIATKTSSQGSILGPLIGSVLEGAVIFNTATADLRSLLNRSIPEPFSVKAEEQLTEIELGNGIGVRAGSFLPDF